MPREAQEEVKMSLVSSVVSGVNWFAKKVNPEYKPPDTEEHNSLIMRNQGRSGRTEMKYGCFSDGNVREVVVAIESQSVESTWAAPSFMKEPVHYIPDHRQDDVYKIHFKEHPTSSLSIKVNKLDRMNFRELRIELHKNSYEYHEYSSGGGGSSSRFPSHIRKDEHPGQARFIERETLKVLGDVHKMLPNGRTKDMVADIFTQIKEQTGNSSVELEKTSVTKDVADTALKLFNPFIEARAHFLNKEYPIHVEAEQ